MSKSKSTKDRYLVLKEQNAGTLMQSLIIGKLVSERDEKVTIKDGIRHCEVLNVRPLVDELGRPTSNYTYILEKFQFPDTVLTFGEPVEVELSKYVYCLEVDETHELARLYDAALTKMRSERAGLISPKDKNIIPLNNPAPGSN